MTDLAKRVIVYVLLALLLLVGGAAAWEYFVAGPDIRERDRVIEAQQDSIQAVDDSIARLMAQKAAGDSARARADSAYAESQARLRVVLATLSRRPVRVVRVPGDTVVRVVIAGDTSVTTQAIAETIERCNALAVTCADLEATSALKALADSASIAQRDSVIVAHEEKDRLQAAKDSTQHEQIEALRERGSRPALTVVLGPFVGYNAAPCGGTTYANDDGVYAVASQECSRTAYGMGVTAGLDMVWAVETIGKILRVF